MRSPRLAPVIAMSVTLAIPTTLFAQSTGAHVRCAMRVSGMPGRDQALSAPADRRALPH